MTAQPVTIRIPADLLAKLPPPSLTGERSQFIVEAIREKLALQEAMKTATYLIEMERNKS